MCEYYTTLEHLRKQNIAFLVTGTWALKRMFSDRLSDYQVKDCDLVIPADLKLIRNLVRLLKKLGWELTLWGQSIDETVSKLELENKYYIRATRDGLMLDVTYENDYLSWEEQLKDSQEVERLQMVSAEQILWLKSKKDGPLDPKWTELIQFLNARR